jgi:hypothetical protein
MNPAAFPPRFHSKLGQLHPLRAPQQTPGEWLVSRHVPQKQFPLLLESVAEGLLLRDLLPVHWYSFPASSRRLGICVAPRHETACTLPKMLSST